MSPSPDLQLRRVHITLTEFRIRSAELLKHPDNPAAQGGATAYRQAADLLEMALKDEGPFGP